MVDPSAGNMPPPARPSAASVSASTSLDRGFATEVSDDEDSHAASPSALLEGSGHSASEDEIKFEPGDGDGHNAPVQKRRRVTRACDECRRKKIKCDGKQPCTHCSVYSYECTYDKPSNRRRNPAPQYLEALESRLQRAEALLRQFMPDVDLNDPKLDPAVQHEFRARELARSQGRAGQPSGPPHEDTKLLSMIESIGQLDLDDQGGWDFHGISSGAVFLRRMKENFQGLMGPVTKVPFLPRKQRPPGLMNLDSGASTGSSPFDPIASHGPELPPKEFARQMCSYSISCATCLIRIVHVPSFWERFDIVYDKPYDTYTLEDNHFLGLIFAAMGLGCMYNSLDEDNQHLSYEEALTYGSKYHDTARRILQDITECRDLASLQALLFMILFLQATSNLSGCYAFIGIALRSAVRMGLHRYLQHEQIGVIEQEVRKRVFWVVRQMDIYVSTMLGFPLLHNSEDIDQPDPTEINDEYITRDGITQPPPGTPSYFEAFNAHTRLMQILACVVKDVYPLRGHRESVMKGDKPGTTYHISYARIKKIEADLQEWYQVLPEHWRPCSEGSIEEIRVRHLLRFAYAHVQLVLYRPFLHYVSPRLSAGKNVDELSYACAAAAISVSRNIVHIGIKIRKQGVLAGPYWFMLYTEFFAVMSLVFYAVENPEKPGSGDVLADAKAGKDMIADLKTKSEAAERVTGALSGLFEQLPERLHQVKTRTIPSKKRSAPSEAVYGRRPTMQSGSQAQHRSDEFARRPGGPASTNGNMAHAATVKSSFDSITPVLESNSFQDMGFSASWQDMMPHMDPTMRTTPDSTSSTGASSQSRPPGYPPPPQQQAQTMPPHANPIHKLGSLMFPSEDPFAYPNQPMMELGFQKGPPMSVSSVSVSGSVASNSNNEMSAAPLNTTFDDWDAGEFLTQPSPFLMHQAQQQSQQQQQTQISPGLDLSSMYQNSTLLGMQQESQGLEQARRAAQMQQRPLEYREMERILAESEFQQQQQQHGNWGYSQRGYQGP